MQSLFFAQQSKKKRGGGTLLFNNKPYPLHIVEFLKFLI